MKFKYCPLCGKKLIQKFSFDEGKVPYCKEHNIMYFDTPKPCVVVAVIKEDQVLLLKQSYIFKNSKVLLSGYVNVGENIEDAVYREVKEEAGIDVYNLKYLGSNFIEEKEILMITFVADYKAGEIVKSPEVEWMGWIPLKNALNDMQEDKIGKQVIKKILGDIK